MSRLRLGLRRRAGKRVTDERLTKALNALPADHPFRQSGPGPVVGESLFLRADAAPAPESGKPYLTLPNPVLAERIAALPAEEPAAAPSFTPLRRPAHGRRAPAREPLPPALLERVAAGLRELPAARPSRGALLLRDRAELPVMRGAARAAGWAAVMPAVRRPAAETPAAYQSYSLEKWQQQAESVLGFVADQARAQLRRRAAEFDRAERAIRARRMAASDAAPVFGYPDGAS